MDFPSDPMPVSHDLVCQRQKPMCAMQDGTACPEAALVEWRRAKIKGQGPKEFPEIHKLE